MLEPHPLKVGGGVKVMQFGNPDDVCHIELTKGGKSMHCPDPNKASFKQRSEKQLRVVKMFELGKV